MNKLLEKSIKVRNELAIKKLADKESLVEWGKTETPPFPVYKKCENIRNSVGWRNLLRQLKP